MKALLRTSPPLLSGSSLDPNSSDLASCGHSHCRQNRNESWGEAKGCLIKGCLNSTKIPTGGIPKTGIPTVGILKTGIPKAGIPKAGSWENPHWDSPQDRDSKAKDSEVRDSEERDSESRDSEAGDSENGQIQGPLNSDTPYRLPLRESESHVASLDETIVSHRKPTSQDFSGSFSGTFL